MSRPVLRALVAASATLAVFVAGRWIGGQPWERGDSMLTWYIFTTVGVVGAVFLAWVCPRDDDMKIGFRGEGK